MKAKELVALEKLLHDYEILSRLTMEHARLADEAKRFKQLGEESAASCPRLQEKEPTTCIDIVFEEVKELNKGGGPYYSYDEIWDEAVAEDRVCLGCQSVRAYKAERVAAKRQLGYIRGALTRVGRRLANEANEA